MQRHSGAVKNGGLSQIYKNSEFNGLQCTHNPAHCTGKCSQSVNVLREICRFYWILFSHIDNVPLPPLMWTQYKRRIFIYNTYVLMMIFNEISFITTHWHVLPCQRQDAVLVLLKIFPLWWKNNEGRSLSLWTNGKQKYVRFFFSPFVLCGGKDNNSACHF